MADKAADFSGVTNPKRVVEKRLDKAEGTDAGELGKSWDDSFQKGGMSQAEFSGYPKGGKRSGPPADMLKKRASKD
jgi:hypothetical protein